MPEETIWADEVPDWRILLLDSFGFSCVPKSQRLKCTRLS